MDVAGDHRVGVGHDGGDPVGEHDLRLRAGLLDNGLVIGHIVHTGKGMHHLTEGGAELLQRQHIVPRVDARLVQLVKAHQMVAHLVGGIAQQQHHLLRAQRDAPQQQGEAVAAEDRERHAHGLAAGLGAHIGGDLFTGGVVALAARHNGFGHGHHVAVAGGDGVVLQRVQDGGHGDVHHIVSLAENRRTHAADDGSQRSAHSNSTPVICLFLRGRSRTTFNSIPHFHHK